MKKPLVVLLALALGLIFVMSCNDPSSIGADLLEQDQADAEYTDTITLRASTVKEDSVLVYDPDPSVEYGNFLVGDLADPVFGNLKAGIFAQLWLGFDPPDYEDAVLDSVVLTMKYDSLTSYGDLTSTAMGLGIYRLQENIPLNEEFYNHQVFDFDEISPLYETSGFIPRVSQADSLFEVLTYSSTGEVDTVTLAPHLRVHLPMSFGQELMEYDSATYSSFSNFLELFNGIYVKALNTSKGVVSFNLADAVSGLTVYYRQQDTLLRQYKYSFSSSGVRFTNFTHEFGGSSLDGFFDDVSKGDSLIFIQSLGGPNVKIEIPFVKSLDDIIVNKAELKFTYAVLPEDDPGVYTPLDRSVVVRKSEVEEAFIFVRDVLIGGAAFGGFVEETDDGNGNIINQYSYNISSYFQDIVDGTRENTIFLRSFPKQENAQRSVLFGPGHSVYPAKLILTYTKLNP